MDSSKTATTASAQQAFLGPKHPVTNLIAYHRNIAAYITLGSFRNHSCGC